MSRKHEIFKWSGYKYAPESVSFSLNGKHINFSENIRSHLAYLAICGENEELLIELKRALRAEEKKPLIIGKCICFLRKIQMNIITHSNLDIILIICMMLYDAIRNGNDIY